MRNSGIILTGDEHFALIQKMNDLEWERDQARAEVERLKAEYHEALQMAANQASTIKQQIEEIERLREDAERYRWLKRQASTVDYDTRVNVIDDILAQYGERWDALIDEAMREGE